MPLLEELRVALTPPKPAPELDDPQTAPRFGPFHVTIALFTVAAVYLASFYWPFTGY